MLLPAPPPFGFKRYIIATRAGQMLLKWESFAEESFKFKESSQVWYNNKCTRYSCC
jgi:hypothetical protein